MVPEARVEAMPPIEASAPGSIGKNRPVIAQRGVELLARDPGLHAAVHVLGMDRQHAVHACEVDADAAMDRQRIALQRGAGAERDDRHGGGGAGRDGRRYLGGRLREGDDIGRLRRVIGLAAAMRGAHRRRIGRALADQRAQRGEDRCAAHRTVSW